MTEAHARTADPERRPALGPMLRSDLRIYLRKFVELFFRFQLQPNLGSIASRVSYQSVDEDAVIREIFPEEDLESLEREATLLHAPAGVDSVPKSADRSRYYPASSGMERCHLNLIYKAVRLTRPNRVVETGVADGRSSRAILQALFANGCGQLTSLEVASDVGTLIEPALKDRWRLEVLPESGRKAAVRRCLVAQAPLDVFIHDSDHSYGWQSFEYRTAYQALRPGGLLISDDIDASFAFVDFVARVPTLALACVGCRKVMGVAVKPSLP
jgi:predicted O-methyltransferase YrrM